MAASDRKLERLINLVAALLDSERPLRREEVFERLREHYAGNAEAMRRTFERDKEVLREMGIPLETVETAGPGGTDLAYLIRREAYELPDPGLTDDELAALRLATVAVELAPGSATEALWKLGAHEGRLEAPPSTATLPGDEHLGSLFSGVVERRQVGFGYKGQRRLVDPWGLGCRGGRWYLRGFDHLRGGERLFRVDRVEGPVEVGEQAGAFERPAGTPELSPSPPWLIGEEVEVEARVLVDADQAGLVAARYGLQPAETRADGSAVFCIPVANRDGFRDFVLDLIDHAEVLSPQELRDDLTSWLEAV